MNDRAREVSRVSRVRRGDGRSSRRTAQPRKRRLRDRRGRFTRSRSQKFARAVRRFHDASRTFAAWLNAGHDDFAIACLVIYVIGFAWWLAQDRVREQFTRMW